jgi:metacaspase-1
MAKTTTTAKPKATALSLHIGLNAVDPGHYDGWSGELAACERDATDMAALARSQRMRPSVLLTRSATRARTFAAVRTAAKVLKRGDLFFLTYSGHGGQVPDVTGEETDKRDETWCLFDGQVIDDEIYIELARFASGVRILVLSDSCHSGTITRDVMAPGMGSQRSRMMPPAVARGTYEKNKEFYDDLQRSIAKAAKRKTQDPDAVLASLDLDPRLTAIAPKFKAAALLISGCQDNQTSMDGDPNGAFTGALLKVWNNGGFTGDYARFHKQIVKGLPASQTPNLFPLGAAGRFIKQQPFRV